MKREATVSDGPADGVVGFALLVGAIVFVVVFALFALAAAVS